MDNLPKAYLDKKYAEEWDPRVCKVFFDGYCHNGSSCKLKHVQPIREVVCKQFLMHGDCQKGPLCLYLHEIIPNKLPECRNFSAEGVCNNSDCKFKHSAKRKTKECAYYNMGYCEQGKHCKFKHVRKVLCREFLENICRNGENCQKYHLKNIAEEYFESALTLLKNSKK